MPQPLLPWLTVGEGPLLIAGPCSVESEEQMLETALQLKEHLAISALRGGVWKPRTKPGSFEGIGQPGLAWLKAAGKATALPVCTEVANAKHVEEALKAEIDFLWIGARTTVNPFYVQEIADALHGVDIPVMVKNPIHPEVGLWLGAFERLSASGIGQLAAIHRGVYAYQSEPFRNEPKWEMMFEMRRLAPDIPLVCDPSHIAGKRELIGEVCQSALDLGVKGFMIEAHRNPDKALSDAAQQLTPKALAKVFASLETRSEFVEDDVLIEKLEELRGEVDEIDAALLDLLEKRLAIVAKIGVVKEDHHITIFQMKRWFKILEQRRMLGKKKGLDEKIVHELFQLIHKYSIDTQIKQQQRLTK
jgi:chorismate mutase